MLMLKRIRFVSLVLILILTASLLTACKDNSEGEDPLGRCVVSRRAEESTKKQQKKEKKQDKEEDSQNSAGESGLPDINQFTAETLDGGTFTEKDLADDLTMINVWQTTCAPCIDEMPGLAELANSLPERVKIITWCLDGHSEPETTADIVGESGFKTPTLIKADGDLLTLGRALMYTPTTILVDSEGNLVGEELIGAQKDPKADYTAYINRGLKSIGKEPL